MIRLCSIRSISVLIPGRSLTASALMRTFVRCVPACRTLVLFDLLGYGESSATVVVSAEEQARILLDALDRLEIHGKVDIFGHLYG